MCIPLWRRWGKSWTGVTPALLCLSLIIPPSLFPMWTHGEYYSFLILFPRPLSLITNAVQRQAVEQVLCLRQEPTPPSFSNIIVNQEYCKLQYYSASIKTQMRSGLWYVLNCTIDNRDLYSQEQFFHLTSGFPPPLISFVFL